MAQLSTFKSQVSLLANLNNHVNNIGYKDMTEVSVKDDVTVTTSIASIHADVHTIWVLIRGYTNRTDLKWPLNSGKGLLKGITSPHANSLKPKLLNTALSMTGIAAAASLATDSSGSSTLSSQQSSSSHSIKLIRKSSPYYLPQLPNDIEKVSAKIAATPGHHCYIKIEIGHDSKEFSKQKLHELIEKACKYSTKFAKRLIIYYTGHGQEKSGNWILHPLAPMTLHTNNNGGDEDDDDQKENLVKMDKYPNSYISVHEVFKAMASVMDADSMAEARIIADCCFSDEWVMRVDDFRQYLLQNESSTTLHVLAAAEPRVYGGNGLAIDGSFAPWLVEETKRFGSYISSKCDKDESWMMHWVDGQMKDLQPLPLSKTPMKSADGTMQSVLAQDSGQDESGDADEDDGMIPQVVVVMQDINSAKVTELQDANMVAQQESPRLGIWQ